MRNPRLLLGSLHRLGFRRCSFAAGDFAKRRGRALDGKHGGRGVDVFSSHAAITRLDVSLCGSHDQR